MILFGYIHHYFKYLTPLLWRNSKDLQGVAGLKMQIYVVGMCTWLFLSLLVSGVTCVINIHRDITIWPMVSQWTDYLLFHQWHPLDSQGCIMDSHHLIFIPLCHLPSMEAIQWVRLCLNVCYKILILICLIPIPIGCVILFLMLQKTKWHIQWEYHKMEQREALNIVL